MSKNQDAVKENPRRLRYIRIYEFLAILAYLASMAAKFIITVVLYGLKV